MHLLHRPFDRGSVAIVVSMVLCTLCSRVSGAVLDADARQAIIDEMLLLEFSVESLDLPGPGAYPERFSVDAVLGGVERRLVLTRRSVRSEDFTVRVWTGPGEHEVWAEPIPITTYAGGVEGEPGWSVRGSLLDGRLFAVVEDNAGAQWGIQPANEVVQGVPADVHVVYNAEDVFDPEQHVCACTGDCDAAGADAGPSGILQTFVLRNPVCGRTAEVAYEADYPFYQANGSSVSSTVSDIEMIQNMVNQVFESEVEIVHQIVSIDVLESSQADPYTSSDSSILLGEFRNRFNGLRPSRPRDVAHLMTGRDLDGNVIGRAYLRVICSTSLDAGISQSRYTSNITRRRNLTAHELGHNWSARHDGDEGCSSSFIMNSSINSASGFSTCSTQDIVSHRNSRSCLDNQTQIGAPVGIDDAYTVDATDQATFDVLQNDTNGSGCGVGLLVSPRTTAAGGLVDVVPSTAPGTRDVIVYSPPLSGVQQDSFTYFIEYNGQTTSSADVAIDLINPRQPDTVDEQRLLPGLSLTTHDTGTQITSTSDIAQGDITSRMPVTTLSYPESTGDLLASGLSDGFGGIFQGYFLALQTQEHTFSLVSDDGSRLWIGDQLVVDNDGVHASERADGSIQLGFGYHQIRIEYFDATRDAELRVLVSAPSISERVVPGAWLAHLPPCEADLNGDNTASVGDILNFLAGWSDVRPIADWNNDGAVTVGDILDYLSTWSTATDCGLED